MIRRIPVLLLSFVLTLAQGQQRRNPQEYIKCLESPERVQRLQVEQVIESLQLSPGCHVADLGSGSGLFTRPLAQKVTKAGRVYAVDIDPALLEHVSKTAREQGLENIQTVQAAEDDPKLPELVDLIFICDTLHHIKNQSAYVKTLRRYLRPSGRIVVIDFRDRWPSGHEDMKYTVQQLDEWMTGAGYSKIANHDFLENAFFLIYR